MREWTHQQWLEFKAARPECQSCPRFRGVLVPPELPSDSKAIVVAEAPGQQEADGNPPAPLIGPSGQAHDAALRAAGLHRGQLAHTNATLCYLDGNPTPDPEEVHACHPILRATVEAVRGADESFPALALGNVALRALTGLEATTKWRGSVLHPPHEISLGTVRVLGPERFKSGKRVGQLKPRRVEARVESPCRRVVASLHPSFVLRTGYKAAPLVVADYKRFGALVHGLPLVEVYEGARAGLPPRTASFDELGDQPTLTLDLETERDSGRITMVGLGYGDERGFRGWTGPLAQCEEMLRPWLKNPEHTVIMHNANFDVRVLEAHGYEVCTKLWDTMWAAHYERPDLPPTLRPKSLDMVSSRQANLDYWNWKYEFKSGLRPDESAYNILDVAWTWANYLNIRRNLDRNGGLRHFERWLMPCLRVLQRMEDKGVPVDMDKLHEVSQLQQEALWAAVEAWNALDLGVKHTENQQLIKLFYHKWKLPIQKKDGKPTLNSDALEALLEYKSVKGAQRQAVELLAHVRHIQKILSTYLNEDKITGDRIHPHFNLIGAWTGRLSCSDPNLQNIPRAPKRGKKRSCNKGAPGCQCFQLRSLFIADDWAYIGGDWSQIEYRLSALLAGDEVLTKNFEHEAFDIHQEVANKLGIPRDLAKTVVHGGNYGRGKRAIAKAAGCTETLAQEVLDGFAYTYPQLAAYRRDIVVQAKRQGYLMNPFGRRFYFEVRPKATEILATMPSSTAAEMMIGAIVRTDAAGLDVRLTVHDELGLNGRSEKDVALLREVLETPYEELGGWSCPADVKFGRSWEDAK